MHTHAIGGTGTLVDNAYYVLIGPVSGLTIFTGRPVAGSD
jgi:hypothetical protein